MSTETRTCQSCKMQFTIEPVDFEFYGKIKVPPQTFCNDCRLQRRMSWRNERALYRRKCMAPGHSEDLISNFAPEKPYIVYDQDYWWSDGWDPMDYGRDYDFSKPFFTQWLELKRAVPHQNVSNSRAENSEYCNVNDKSKDCYLISAAFENENVMYSNRVSRNKDTLDCYFVNRSEGCYDDVICMDSFKLFFSQESENCADSAFLYDCHNCIDCFGCTNLRKKQYYFFNEPCTREKYLQKIKEYDLGSFAAQERARARFEELKRKAIRRYASVLKAENSIGDNLYEAKNCTNCFDFWKVENCKNVVWGLELKDTYDSGPGVGAGSELMYETFDQVANSNVFFTSVVYDSSFVQYSFNCYNSNDLFGCFGLKKKQYCILNKQYTKEEYERLVPKIIEHMNAAPYIDAKGRTYRYGEFFPAELSPFGYNETVAQEYFPRTKEEALAQGFAWRENEARHYGITKKAEDLPDHIKDVPDSIINDLISCAHGSPPAGGCNDQCTVAFKIMPAELYFYRRMNLALPRLCPNCRHYGRLRSRNPLRLAHRQCMCAAMGHSSHITGRCKSEFETTYTSERPEAVYCEACYQAEMV